MEPIFLPRGRARKRGRESLEREEETAEILLGQETVEALSKTDPGPSETYDKGDKRPRCTLSGNNSPTTGHDSPTTRAIKDSPGAGESSPKSSAGKGVDHGDTATAGETPKVETKTYEKKGSCGMPVKLYANYFQWQQKLTHRSMRLYTVSFDPEIEGPPVRKALIRIMENEIGGYIFDGTQMFAMRELPSELLQFKVAFPDKPEAIWNVTITFQRIVSALEPVAFQIYNLIVKKMQQSLNLSPLGRFYFDPAGKIDIHAHKLQLWPGMITSARQFETDLMLNVDLTFKVIRTDNVLTVMSEIRRSNSDPLQLRRECEEAIVGTTVITQYNRESKKQAYRIDAIDWGSNPTSTFPINIKGRGLSEKSYLDYYKEKYGISIGVHRQPLLVSEPKERDIRRGKTAIKLVPELCYQAGLNDSMRGDFRLMKAISNHLHQPPSQRLRQVQEFVKRIGDSEKVKRLIQDRWGIRIKPEPVEVEGRVLPQEKIIFQKNMYDPTKAEWSQAFRRENMFSCRGLKCWAIIATQRDSCSIGHIVQTMVRVATPLGYQIEQPDVVRVHDNHRASFVKAIQDAMTRHRDQLDMIMIILPNSNLETYAAVKKVCTIDYGVPSQCFLSKNASSKGLMSICTKMVIQMNAKQGGEPWSVSNPLKGVMVVGFDAHHEGGKSYAAMVASISPSLARYYSTIIPQERGMEMSTRIGEAFLACLRAYHTENKELPKRVFFYRDGVGEGQLQFVNDLEVPKIKNIFNKSWASLGNVGGGEPKLTFIVVTKKNNTRFFLGRGAENPEPGTIVDSVVTYPERYDFYLVPQTARQGTISPISYNVLTDNSGLDADRIQRFTYKLCHMYFNWSGTINVPAPCQYAHKLAFLTGTALQREANKRLCDLLHFL